MASIGLFTYENDYSIWDELETLELYKYKEVQFILNFKWNKFGFKYYCGLWMIHIAFLSCFVTTQLDQLPNEARMLLIIITIIFGVFHFYFEIKQFTCNPKKYIRNIANLFDFIAYLLATITSIISIIWLVDEKPPPSRQLISFSNLLLSLKFILFLRVFKPFEGYYAIILGVVKNFFSFLFFCFLIILSFSHAFYTLLKPSQDFTIDEPAINDGKQFGNKTNKFEFVSSSILAIFNMLTGDNSAFESRKLLDDPYLAILYAAVTLIFIVSMAVFNGLLSNDIEKIDRKNEFWVQRARIIAEIELYYLDAEQRCRKDWFPDRLTYNVSIDEIRKGIIEIDSGNEDPKPFIPDELRKLVGIPKLIETINIRTKMERMENDIKRIKDELRNTNNKKEIEERLKKNLEKK